MPPPSNNSLQKAHPSRFGFLTPKSPQDEHAKVAACFAYLSLLSVSYYSDCSHYYRKNFITMV